MSDVENHAAIQQLREIHNIASRNRPYPEQSRLDPLLAYALGRIIGICGSTLALLADEP